jgi:mRNA-degrading endonuclease RelE of RelBE toxin-antitoxin system
LKAIPGLPVSQREEIGSLVNTLENDPIPYHSFDVKGLGGVQDAYRVRLGGVRVVYFVDWENSVITVTRIEPRGRVYKGS